MIRNFALSRPAISAIAAFLALSTPAAFAQEMPTVTMTPPVAAPAPQTPPTAPEPTTVAPVTTPQAAQPPAQKPVIRVPLDIAPEASAPAPKAAERAATRAPRATHTAQRTQPATAAATPPAAVPVAAAPITETSEMIEATPIVAPVIAPAEPVVDAAPLPVESVGTTDSYFPWEIAGGAALLLILGGAAVVFARRRRVEYERGEEAPTYGFERTPTPSIAAPEPVADDAQPWISPAYVPSDEAVIAPRNVPAFAAAPSGSMGRHEAMAMAGPTEDNPFTTLHKRLKRARFLDQQERVAYDEALGEQKDMTRKPISAWEIAQRPVPATQEQEVRRAEPARVRTTTTFRPGYSNN